MVLAMGIGETLREAREANNLSLDDIQEMTKIQKRYLAAIEQDDYHALPGRFYARAFIKEYAQSVGLDANEVLDGFDEGEIETEEETVQYTRLERSKRSRAQKSSSIFSMLPTVIVIILGIGIIFVAWTLYQQTLSNSYTKIKDRQENDEIIRSVDEQDKSADSDESEEEQDEAGDEQEEDVEEDENLFSVVETGTGERPESELDFNYSNDELKVTFEVTDRTYVDLIGASDTTYLS